MKIPYYRQEKDYTCGSASARMILASFGIKKSERTLAKEMKTTRARGTRASAFTALAQKYGLNYAAKKKATLGDLKKYLRLGHRVIVGYFYDEEEIGHFAVVKKITEKSIHLLDPIWGPDYKMNLKKFLKLWRRGFKHDREKSWFIGFSASAKTPA